MIAKLLFVAAALTTSSATPILPAILDTETGGSSSSSTVLLHTTAGGAVPNIFYGMASNGGFSFDADASVYEAIAVNTSQVDSGTVSTKLLSDGASQHDFRAISCLNSTHCVAGSSGVYVPAGKGGAFLTTDGGATWKLSTICTAAGSDSMSLLGVNYHSPTHISVNGKTHICYSKDGGATWSTFDIYQPGITSHPSGDCGNLFVFRALSNSGNTIRFQYMPGPQSGAEVTLYNNSIDTATNSLGTARLLYTYTGSYTFTYVLHYPNEQETLGYALTGSGDKWVTLNGGRSWTKITSNVLGPTASAWPSRWACPQAESGTCYTVVSGDLVKAVSPFTTWTKITTPFPAPTVGSYWNYGSGSDGFQAIACARSGGADKCILPLYGMSNVTYAASSLLVTNDGFATMSLVAVSPDVTGIGAAVVNWANTIITSGGTATHFLIGGTRGQVVKVEFNALATPVHVHPVVPRTSVVEWAQFSDGTGLIIGNGVVTRLGANNLALTAGTGAPTYKKLFEATALAPYAATGDITAAGIFSDSTFLVAASNEGYYFDGSSDPGYFYGVRAGRQHGIFLTTDGGTSFTKVCEPWPAPAVGTYATPFTRQVKVERSRAFGADAAQDAAYIVHPFFVYKWDGSTSSCGEVVASFAPPDVTKASNFRPVSSYILSYGCSPDPNRGCYMLRAEMEQSVNNTIFGDGLTYKIHLDGDCGSTSFVNGASNTSVELWDAGGNPVYAHFGASSDIIFGSASFAIAYSSAANNALGIMVDGASFAKCDLTSCVTPAYYPEATVQAATFISPTRAFVYISSFAYAGVADAVAAELLQLDFAFAAGAGSVVKTRLALALPGGGVTNSARFLLGRVLTANPRFFPAAESGNGTGCDPLPSDYAPPAPAPPSPAPTPSVSASSSASASVSGSVTASASVSASQSASATASPSASPSSSSSASVSSSSSSSVTASVAATASVSPSVAATTSTTPSVTASPSESASVQPAIPSSTPSVTASATTSPSASGSASASGSGSPTASASASASPSGSGSGSPSITASESKTGSATASPSASAQSPSVSSSVTISPSTTASASVSGSVTPSVTGSATVSSSGSASSSMSASVTPSVTGSATVSPTTSGSASVTASVTGSATATRSVTPTSIPQAPRVAVEVTLVGGGIESLAAGGSTDLRRGIAELSSIEGASAQVVAVVTNTSIVDTSALRALANSTSNSTDILNATGVALTSTFTRIDPSDPYLNRQLDGGARRRRQLQGASVTITPAPGAGCVPVNIYEPGSAVVKVSSVLLEVILPATFYLSAQDPLAAAEAIRARIIRQLSDSSAVERSLGRFLTIWANCSGLPASSSVIAKIGSSAVVIPAASPVAQPPSDGDSGLELWKVVLIILGSIAVASLLAGVCLYFYTGVCICCGGGRKRTDGAFPLIVALSPASAAALGRSIEPFAVQVRPITQLRDAVRMATALLDSELPLDVAALERSSFLFGKRLLVVAEVGESSMESLGINRRNASAGGVLTLGGARSSAAQAPVSTAHIAVSL